LNLLLAIGAGVAIGSILRYSLAKSVQPPAGTSFARGAMIANILGSVTIGLTYVWLMARIGAPHTLRLFLIGGVLGGFTNFSLKTVTLMMQASCDRALLDETASVVLCLIATRPGIALARLY